MINKKFGRLTVLKLEYKKQRYTKNGKKDGFDYFYLCHCECGNTCTVDKKKLKSGHTQSCGCLQKERTSKAKKIHGMEKTRLYHIWQGIKRRCLNPNEVGFKKYGAKGITICDEWKNNPVAFINWAFENGYNDFLTIDRIDNLKGYSPNNCRWVTTKQQARNKTNNRLITYNNETHCLTDWAIILGIKLKTLETRIYNHKWSIERAFSTPVRKRRKNGF